MKCAASVSNLGHASRKSHGMVEVSDEIAASHTARRPSLGAYLHRPPSSAAFSLPSSSRKSHAGPPGKRKSLSASAGLGSGGAGILDERNSSPWSKTQALLLGDLAQVVLLMLGLHEVKLTVSFLQELTSLPIASLALGVTLPDLGHVISRCAGLQREEQPSSSSEWIQFLSRSAVVAQPPSPKAPRASVKHVARQSMGLKEHSRKSHVDTVSVQESGSNLNGRVVTDGRPLCEVSRLNVDDGQGKSIESTSRRTSGESDMAAAAIVTHSLESDNRLQELAEEPARSQSQISNGSGRSFCSYRSGFAGDEAALTQNVPAPDVSAPLLDEEIRPPDINELRHLVIQESSKMNPGREVALPNQTLETLTADLPGASTDDSQSIEEDEKSDQVSSSLDPVVTSVRSPPTSCLRSPSRLTTGRKSVFSTVSRRPSTASRISTFTRVSRFSTFSKVGTNVSSRARHSAARVSEKVKSIFTASRKSWRESISGRLNIIPAGAEAMERYVDETWLAEPSHQFILNPSSTGRMSWDCLSLVVILFEAMAVPFVLCFDLDTPEALLMFMTGFFSIDICLNFLTGFYRTGVLVMKQVEIIRNYLETWFILDVLSTFPWGVFFTGSSSATMLKIWKFAKMIRLIRLLRVAKLRMLVKRIEEIFSSSVMIVCLSLSKILALFVLIVHWCACVWGWLGHPDRRSQNSKGQQVLGGCEPGGPCEPGIEGSPWRRRYRVDSFTISHQYVVALRFAAGVFTGSDMGVQPGFWAERVYTICLMMIAFVICSTIISQIVVVFHKIQKEDSEQNDLIQAFREFMAARKVPFQLQQKVKRYLEYQHASRKEVSAKRFELMERLSPWLHKELEMHLNKGVLVQCTFFKKMPHEILAHTCTMCKLALAAPGDIILQRGQTAKIMCFLVRGKLHIRMSGNSLVFDYDNDKTEDEASGTGRVSPTTSFTSGDQGQGAPTASMLPNWSNQGLNASLDESRGAGEIQGFTLTAPGYIGAASLFMDEVRAYTAIAISHCELLTLTRNDVEWIATEFPSARAYIENFVNQAESEEGGFQDMSVQPGSDEDAILKRL